MPGYLLDTNHLGAALRADSPVRRGIVRARRPGSRIGTCVPVLCELEAGLQAGSRPDHYRVLLDRLLAGLRIWPIDPPVARIYGGLYCDLRARGRALSQIDILLAALARSMDLTLLTTDRDFDALPDLRVEDWSS